MKHPTTHNPPWVLKCNACFQTKVETDFHPNPENRTGRAGTCMACRRHQIKLAQRERREKAKALRLSLGLTPEVGSPTTRTDVGKPHKRAARTEKWNPRPDAPITRAEHELPGDASASPTTPPTFTDLFKFGPN